MIKLQTNLLAVNSAPHKIQNQFESLREKFGSYYTHVPYESPVHRLGSLVYVHASDPMSQLLSIVEGHDFEVVSFVAVLHLSEQSFGVVERISHRLNQLGHIVGRKIDKLCLIHLQRLQLQFSFRGLLGFLSVTLLSHAVHILNLVTLFTLVFLFLCTIFSFILMSIVSWHLFRRRGSLIYLSLFYCSLLIMSCGTIRGGRSS